MPDDDKPITMQESPTAVAAADERPMEMSGEIWMTTNDQILMGSRVPFTKREKEFLCSLIQKHVYSKIAALGAHPSDFSFSQGSGSTFCRVPSTAWKAIFDEYNSKENVRKRTVKQLRKCWENLKHRGKINPEALYSGKRLHGRTSLSGAFTLTTVEDETQMSTAPVQATQGSPFKGPATVDESANLSLNGGTSPTQTLGVFSSVDSSTMRPSESSFKEANGESDSTEPLPQNLASEVIKDSPREKIVTSSSFATPHFVASSSRPTMVSPRITNVRTVRWLKPAAGGLNRRFPTGGSFSRLHGSRLAQNYPSVAKTHAQKLQEMKVKLMSARIKEHEANVEKIHLQMRQAQAHHDVTMRLLRTRAAWYDAHLRQLEKRLQTGELSLVGEDDEDYPNDAFADEDAIQYERSFD